MPDEDTEKYTKSRYKVHDVPVFKSAIPPHILAKLSEGERYLMELTSINEQSNAWLEGATKTHSESVVELDLRLMRVEEIISMVTSKWALISALLILSIPVIIKYLLDKM